MIRSLLPTFVFIAAIVAYQPVASIAFAHTRAVRAMTKEPITIPAGLCMVLTCKIPAVIAFCRAVCLGIAQVTFVQAVSANIPDHNLCMHQSKSGLHT